MKWWFGVCWLCEYIFTSSSILITIIVKDTKLSFIPVTDLCVGYLFRLLMWLQKVTVIAGAVTTPVGRRRLLAQINSFIAVFILAGQLTLTVWIDSEFNVLGIRVFLVAETLCILFPNSYWDRFMPELLLYLLNSFYVICFHMFT